MSQSASLFAQLSQEEKYKEACQLVRHYSTCVINLRAFTIAQGLAVVGAAGYFSKDRFHWYALATTAFGMLLTWVLYSFHASYLAYFLAGLTYATTLEGGAGPWTEYNAERCARRQGFLYKIMHLYGGITVIFVSLSFVAVYNILRLLMDQASSTYVLQFPC